MAKPDSQLPDITFERAAFASGYRRVCGMDEAGRGPLAGPVVASAVVLDLSRIPKGLNDSKKLTPARRDALYDEIMANADVGVHVADEAYIDKHNILAASLWCMAEAAKKLREPVDFALVDGNRSPKLHYASQAVVSGDARALSIAAASIIAKVTRDRLMLDLHALYPMYGFDQHKGYGTAQHHQALERFGPCPCHRKSFMPIKQLVLL